MAAEGQGRGLTGNASGTPPLVVFDAAATPGTTPGWRGFTDAVMGGESVAAVEAATVLGRAAVVLRGRVSTANGGGFVQMALELPPLPADAAGIEIDACVADGEPRRWNLHLRGPGLALPWQAWRAGFDAPASWATLRLPWAAFAPYRHALALAPRRVSRLGVVALAPAGDVAIAVARVAVYG